MSDPKIFVLDANPFVEAYRRYYAFDLCPGFWEALIHFSGSRIESIDRVLNELKQGKDDLSDWATKKLPKKVFKSTKDAGIATCFGDLVTWVQGQPQFLDDAKAEFAGGVDGWLIAYAKTQNRVLVTHEEHSPDARKKVPIPNVCKQFGVPWINTFQMLRELEVHFSWRPK